MEIKDGVIRLKNRPLKMRKINGVLEFRKVRFLQFPQYIGR